MPADILTFSVLATLLVLVPGLDFTLVLRFASTQSRNSAFAVMLGITSGLFVWGVFASLGISAILQTSEAAYNVLRIFGVCYMGYMGVGFIRSSFKSKTEIELGELSQNFLKSFAKGLFSNLLNPKAGVFYISVLPQFIASGQSKLVMGLLLTSIHALITIVYFTLVITFVSKAKKFVSNQKVKSSLEFFSGIAVIGFGIHLLSSSANG